MRALRLSILVMAAIFTVGLVNSAALSRLCSSWTAELDTAAVCAESGDWQTAQQRLDALRQSWQGQQGYLCATLKHDAIDEADTLLHECILFADRCDASALADSAVQLRLQLSRLAETERLSLKNVL